MEPLARSERARLCNTALETGPDAPTLSGSWTVRDLVTHLLVRERDPLGAPGIVLPPLAGLTRSRMARLREHDFASLVERLRGGPPVWSPMALPPLDRVVNGAEFLVHHEDIRRGSPGWSPRELRAEALDQVWALLASTGRTLVRRAGVPVRVEWESSTGVRTAVLRRGPEPVVLRGEPLEMTLRVFGRTEVRGLEYDGPQTSISAFQSASLGM